MKQILLLFLALSLTVISCERESTIVPEQEEILTTSISSRGQTSCVPEGDNCVSLGTFTFSFTSNGCQVKVWMDLTRCDDGQNIIIYFEEDKIELLSGSGCDFSNPLFIESLYDQAVSTHMQNYGEIAPDCNSGSTQPVVESRLIKLECVQICATGYSNGQYVYEWLPCATVQSCCIVSKEWCVDGEGNMIPFSETSNQVGQCEGEFTPQCWSMWTNCIPSRCN